MKIRQLIKYLHNRKDFRLTPLIESMPKFLVCGDNIPDDIIDSAEKYAADLFAERIVPLPFDTFILEVQDNISMNADAMWVLAKRTPDGIVVMMMVKYHDIGITFNTSMFSFMGNDHKSSEVVFNHRDSPPENIQTNSDHLMFAFKWLRVLVGLLATGAGIIQETVLVKDKRLNDRRVRAGKLPLEYEHTVVRIDPTLLRLPGLVAAGGTHASPRLHWRRGHTRKLSGGRLIAVKPCIVGDVSRGVVTHDYLIGERDATH